MLVVCCFNKINRLIWAFHVTTEPTEEFFDSSSISPHTNKGAQSLNLDSGMQHPVELEDDIQYIDIFMNNVSLPSTDTTYWCKLFKIPELDSTHHVVRFSPVISEGNEGAVHHLVGWECAEWLVTDNDIGFEGVCETDFENMPANACRNARVSYGWAIGGEDMYLPENAGFPIGGDSGTKYLLLEIHYDVCTYIQY